MGFDQSTAHRVWLEIDLDILADNFRKIKSAVAPCKVIAVLKANAYGLGVKRIANALVNAGASGFGVAELREALELAETGVPVQILGNVLESEISTAVQQNIVLPICDLRTAQLINDEAAKQNKIAECHFLVDTGMGRLGIQCDEAFDVIKEAIKLPHIKCTGIYSHFPVAYSEGSDYTLKQVNTFKALLAELKSESIEFETVHVANSDAVNNFEFTYEAPFNAVRTGINLHGSFDPEGKRTLDVEPVLTLKTKLASVRTLPAGTSIGYGLTCKLEKDTVVGTIAAGYADGLPLALSNKGHVLINNQPCRILGRVSMDYTTVSLEEAPGAQCGDDVICLGGSGEHAISVEDWAEIKNTHAYEIICSFGTRVERRYLTKSNK